MKRIRHWIDGEEFSGEPLHSGPVYNPATGAQTGVVNFASAREVDAAVASAKGAFESWRETPISRRSEVIFRFRELVLRHRNDIARLLTAENGKVFSDALGEVGRGLENIEFACGVGELLKGGYSEGASSGVDVYSIRQPLGVVAGVTPFNFPAMVPLWMLPGALACGNAFVLKPSEKDPSAPVFLMELLAEAGLPPGAANLIQGDSATVERLLDHPDVAAVSFVGSTAAARSVYERGTRNGKRVQALGGAKNHMVVLPDAQIDLAADAAVSAAYGSAGERCMAISAVVAVGGVGDVLVPAIAARLDKVKVGPGDDPDSEMGPLITREHRDRVAGYVDSAAAEGATIIRDGRGDDICGSDGFFLGLSLIDDVTTEMSPYRDEIFGPVLCVLRVDTLSEALQLLAESPWGNGAAVFTTDGAAARRFQSAADAGMVGINVPIPVPVSYYSFGGWKGSLFGDTHMYGPEGIHFYTRTKVVTARWPYPSSSVVDLGFTPGR